MKEGGGEGEEGGREGGRLTMCFLSVCFSFLVAFSKHTKLVSCNT